jgi:hypothetical protein
MRREFQALPEAVASQADQNEPADDDQRMQHGGLSARRGVGFKSRKSGLKRPRPGLVSTGREIKPSLSDLIHRALNLKGRYWERRHLPQLVPMRCNDDRAVSSRASRPGRTTGQERTRSSRVRSPDGICPRVQAKSVGRSPLRHHSRSPGLFRTSRCGPRPAGGCLELRGSRRDTGLNGRLGTTEAAARQSSYSGTRPPLAS